MTSVVEIFVGLLLTVAVLALVARKLNIPYPILFVIGGLLLALIPKMPPVRLNPELVFLFFLPPLLFPAAVFTSWRDFRANLRPISLLAVGLVLFTTGAVAFLANYFLAMPLAAGFVLGAIVSPPDAVAATAIAQRLKVPRRIVTILEGESLVNDATALVAYRFGVAAVVTGKFSLAAAGGEFVVAGVGGILTGLAVGWLAQQLHRRVDDAPIEITVSLLTPFVAYLAAQRLGLSGVLAVVTAGLYLGWRVPELLTFKTRLPSWAVWGMVQFLLNGFVFILIGLQLPAVLQVLSDHAIPIVRLIGYALLISLTVVIVRFLWVFAATYLPFVMFKRVREQERFPKWQNVTIVGWTGMRGVVSLAAALALPISTQDDSPFPGRDLILFVTFAVILTTLVVQGLTLPWLIRTLRAREDGEEERREEIHGRLAIAQAALERIDELSSAEWTNDETIERVRALYEFRRRRFKVQAGKLEDEDGIEERSLQYQRLMHRIYDAQREVLVGLRDDGEVSSEVMRRLERELDLEESRLEV